MHQDNGNLGDVSARSCLLLRRAREGERKHLTPYIYHMFREGTEQVQSVIDIHNRKLMIYELV